MFTIVKTYLPVYCIAGINEQNCFCFYSLERGYHSNLYSHNPEGGHQSNLHSHNLAGTELQWTGGFFDVIFSDMQHTALATMLLAVSQIPVSLTSGVLSKAMSQQALQGDKIQ